MNAISASDMFSTMQRLAEQSRPGISEIADAAEATDIGTTRGGGFDAVLKSMVERVNETKIAATEASNAFSRQDPGVDLADAMIAMQRARVHFEAMVQVRNRLVNAYEEIMRMPL